MALNDVYSEVEAEKANKVDSLDGIKLESQHEFIEEHRYLIKTLREGSREELLACAEEQEEELEKFLEMNNLPPGLACEDGDDDEASETDSAQ